MFTKKHFEQVAAIVRQLRIRKEREAMTNMFAALFQASNPRFDRARFVLACNPKFPDFRAK